MFTKNGKGRPRGRPPGPTEQGSATRERLYAVAVDLIARRGYEETTLRDIARKAGVSVGLLYRYFPSKRAVVVALYDRLSADYAAKAARMPEGTWRERFLFALRKSLSVLGGQRAALTALLPVLVGDGAAGEGMLAPSTAFSRKRVQAAFESAVAGATDVPDAEDAAALAQVLYLVHLAVILWWLLDRSPRQKATKELVAELERLLPLATLVASLEPTRKGIRTAAALIRKALLQ